MAETTRDTRRHSGTVAAIVMSQSLADVEGLSQQEEAELIYDAAVRPLMNAIADHRDAVREHTRVASSCDKCDGYHERLWTALERDGIPATESGGAQ